MQAVLAKRNPSVRLSVKRVNCDKTKETSAKIFIPYIFSERRPPSVSRLSYVSLSVTFVHPNV